MTPDEIEVQGVLRSWARRMAARLGLEREPRVDVHTLPAVGALAWIYPGLSGIWYNSARWQPGAMTGPVGYNVMIHEITHALDAHVFRHRDRAKGPWRRETHDALFKELHHYCRLKLGAFSLSDETERAALVPVDPSALVRRPGQKKALALSFVEDVDDDSAREPIPPEIAQRLVGHLATIWRWRDRHQAAQAA